MSVCLSVCLSVCVITCTCCLSSYTILMEFSVLHAENIAFRIKQEISTHNDLIFFSFLMHVSLRASVSVKTIAPLL